MTQTRGGLYMTRNQAFGALLGLLKIKFNIPGLFFESLNIQVFGISPNQSYDMGIYGDGTFPPSILRMFRDGSGFLRNIGLVFRAWVFVDCHRLKKGLKFLWVATVVGSPWFVHWFNIFNHLKPGMLLMRPGIVHLSYPHWRHSCWSCTSLERWVPPSFGVCHYHARGVFSATLYHLVNSVKVRLAIFDGSLGDPAAGRPHEMVASFIWCSPN